MKSLLFRVIPIVFALFSSSAIAQGAHAHHHGVGQLGIVLDQDQLSVVLEVPQYDLVGFERAPASAREQLTVQAALEKLNAPEKLFAPSAAAQCQAVEKKIEAPLLAANKPQDGHGDVAARYVFRCAKPEALKDLTVQVMAAFKRVRSLNVSFAGPKGQKAGKLDARNTRFAW
jgi:hypothetical protein